MIEVFVSHPGSSNHIINQIFEHLPRETIKSHIIDEQKLSVGSSIERRINLLIERSNYVISFLNREALKSRWVQMELELAYKREDALGGGFILPVLLGDFPEKSLPKRLKGRRFLTYRGGGYPRAIAAFANELTDELFRLICERPALASEGIAGVYFFNFIEPFSKIMIRSPGEFHLEELNKVRRPVKAFQIRLCVVLPESLEENFERIREKLSLQEGKLMEGEKRLFTVSYRATQDLQAPESITLYDVPNILTSVVKLLNLSKYDEELRRSPAWDFRNKSELGAFKIHLERVISTLDPEVVSRINVRSHQAVA